ncbi:hypothetical protein Peur_066117 [Populus x canadensis]
MFENQVIKMKFLLLVRLILLVASQSCLSTRSSCSIFSSKTYAYMTVNHSRNEFFNFDRNLAGI